MVECSVLEELDLTAKEMLSWKAARERVMRFWRGAADCHRSSSERSEALRGQGNRGDERVRAGSSVSGGGEGSSKQPERECIRMK